MAVQYCNSRDGSILFGKLAQIMKYHCLALSISPSKSDKIDALSYLTFNLRLMRMGKNFFLSSSGLGKMRFWVIIYIPLSFA
jgi:hypothetical protein